MPSQVQPSADTSLAQITDAWRSGRPERMAELLDPAIVMVLADFTHRVTGRDALIESFIAFSREAEVVDYRELKRQIDRFTDTAIAQVQFEMVYEREGSRWRSSGWDVWVFERRDTTWIAVWRIMQALREESVGVRDRPNQALQPTADQRE